ENTRLVWDETTKVLDNVFQNVWGDRDAVKLDNIMDLTVPFTLLVIGIAGFGRRMSWSENQDVLLGHSLTFKDMGFCVDVSLTLPAQDAMYKVSHHLVLKVLFPDRALPSCCASRPRMTSSCRVGVGSLQAYLHEMVAARRAAEVKEERFDLMSNLLDVNEDGTDSMAKLLDSALTENVFLFSVQDEQEVFCQNCQSVLPANRVQTYEDFICTPSRASPLSPIPLLPTNVNPRPAQRDKRDHLALTHVMCAAVHMFVQCSIYRCPVVARCTRLVAKYICSLVVPAILA
ncbi:hypothetical protein BD309DRAFT_854296, partial [Dichomitus squalens]